MCKRSNISGGIFEVQLTANTRYNYTNKLITSNTETITLTPNEISLIELLIENNNKLVRKLQIEDIVYKNNFVSDSAINTLVSKLRKKIGKKYYYIY